jgi:hypothetical protein
VVGKRCSVMRVSLSVLTERKRERLRPPLSLSIAALITGNIGPTMRKSSHAAGSRSGMLARLGNRSRIPRAFVFLSVALVALVIVTGLVPVLPGAGIDIGGFNSARAASDPVIAAAGDIACDPLVSSFNKGSGTSSACRQKYTSNLLVNAGLAAILDLGDNQYYCGGYHAFLESYDLSWGRVKSITHPAVGNHEYLASGGSTDCTSANEGAAGYFGYFGSAAGDTRSGVLQLQHWDLAYHCPEFQLQQCWRLWQRFFSI